MRGFAAVVAVIAVASASLVPAAFAQQTDRAPGATQAPSRGADKADKARESFKAPDGVMESKKIIGTKIKDAAGKDLGEIDQLLVDAKTGKVTHAVVGKGGMLGVGETRLVVPWTAVSIKADMDNRDRLVATVEPSALDSAPRYDRRAAGADRPSASPRTGETRPPAQR
jgi:sporulation protein YlmC with PRC-barrel domain